MILRHSHGFQFKYKDGYTISIFIPTRATEELPEPGTSNVKYVEAAFFRENTYGDRIYFNPHSDFSPMDEYLSSEGEIVYENNVDLFLAHKRFVEKFNLAP